MIVVTGRDLPLNPVVAVGGVSAPVIASSATSITMVVPFELPSSWTTLEIQGIDAGVNLLTAGSAPALFTVDGSGKGQVEAYNSDGSANSPDNPAAAGSVVFVFMTGAGAMFTPIADGALGPQVPPYPVPIQNVIIVVNGVATQNVLVAQAPGRIAGVVRVDFKIPASTPPGEASVGVTLGVIPANEVIIGRGTIFVR